MGVLPYPLGGKTRMPEYSSLNGGGPSVIPAPEKPMSRFEAQRKLGLFAPHDVAMFAGIVIGLVLIAAQAIFVSEVDKLKLILELGVVILFTQAWLVVLVYRALVFILDLHSEVSLMPEAAARIAAGYFEGRKPAK